MSRLLPDGFLSIRQAAEMLVVAMYSGVPDRLDVQKLREAGYNVADGAASAKAISKLWVAVDRGKVQALLIGPNRQKPLKLSAEMSKGIPTLRSDRGGDFTFLRSANPYHRQFVEWFGRDLSLVAVVFQEDEIRRLARTLLGARRRRTASAGSNKAGRPSRLGETKENIREIVEGRRWSPTQSIKSLTELVNRRAKWPSPVGDDTVGRALKQLHSETGDRRFERLHRPSVQT